MKIIAEIDEPEFEVEVLRSAEPVLVGFLAGRSHACRLFEPVLEKVAEVCIGKAKVLKVNVDDNPDLALWYGIRAFPTLIYFIDGNVRAKFLGIGGAKAILAKLQSLAQGTKVMTESERQQQP